MGSVDSDVAERGRSLADELAQQRLEHRARRIARTLVSLRALADIHGSDAPRPLRSCIDDLEREHAAVNERLLAYL